jgi:hypothetical protein
MGVFILSFAADTPAREFNPAFWRGFKAFMGFEVPCGKATEKKKPEKSLFIGA